MYPTSVRDDSEVTIGKPFTLVDSSNRSVEYEQYSPVGGSVNAYLRRRQAFQMQTVYPDPSS